MRYFSTHCFAVLLAVSSSFWATGVFAMPVCGDHLAASDSLTTDLDCPGPGPALTVVANDVVLKLNGHRISASGGVAIEVIGRGRFALQGPGRVFWTSVGVYAARADNLNVSNVDFEVNVASSVHLANSRNAVIRGNRFFGDGIMGAVRVFQPRDDGVGAGGHQIIDNVFDSLDVGIGICGSDAGGNRISGNSFGPGVFSTLEIRDEASRNVITGNKFRSGTGTVFIGSDENQFIANVFEGGHGVGVSIEALGGAACFRRSGAPRTTGNIVAKNQFYGVANPVWLGEFVDGANAVTRTRLYSNTIRDAATGIRFGLHAYDNNATGNTYVRTVLPVRDDGIGNIY